MLLEILQHSQENTCESLFFNKVAGLGSATLLKKRLWHRCFPGNFAKFLRTLFLQNTSGRLFLSVLQCYKKVILKSIKTKPDQVLIFLSLKFLVEIKFGLSHFNDQEFQYIFQDCVNLICGCGQKIETSIHFFLHCSNCYLVRQTVSKKVNKTNSEILKQNNLF